MYYLLLTLWAGSLKAESPCNANLKPEECINSIELAEHSPATEADKAVSEQKLQDICC